METYGNAGTARDGDRRPWEVLSGNALKLLACVCMAVDHIGAVLILNGVIYGGGLSELEYAKWKLAYDICRTIGRLAFPIFCFILVEGFIHTRDWRRYAARLGAFALIAEVPFDLAIWGRPVDWAAQSVMVSLLIGVFMMAGIRAIEQREAGPISVTGLFCRLMVIAAAGVAAMAVKSDYEYLGIVLIAILYEGRTVRMRSYLAGAVWAYFYWSDYLPFRLGAAASFLPISMYNGQRGRWRLKYVFYWFYPVHLLVLHVIYRVLFSAA